VVIDSHAELSRPPPLRYTVSLAHNLSFLAAAAAAGSAVHTGMQSAPREGRQAMGGPSRLSPWFIDCECGAHKALSTSSMFTAGSCISKAPGCVPRPSWRDRLWATNVAAVCPTIGRSRPSAARLTLATYPRRRADPSAALACRPRNRLSLNQSLANSAIRALPTRFLRPRPAAPSLSISRAAQLYSISSIDAYSQPRPDLQPFISDRTLRRRYLIFVGLL